MKPQSLSLWKVLNSAIETAEIKLMGNINELNHDIAERNTGNVMVGEIEFLRAELTASIEISAEGICDIGSINSCDNHSDKTSLLKVKAIL